MSIQYFMVEVYTSHVNEAGTDADVVVDFVSNTDFHCTLLLDDPNFNDLEKGMLDVYYLKIDDSTGSSFWKHMNLFFRPRGHDAKWKVDEIRLHVGPSPEGTNWNLVFKADCRPLGW